MRVTCTKCGHIGYARSSTASRFEGWMLDKPLCPCCFDYSKRSSTAGQIIGIRSCKRRNN